MMRFLSTKLTFLIGMSVICSSAKALEVSVGGGYPYFLIPEVSYISEQEKIKWYANLKIGYDSGGGPSLGFEKQFYNPNHAWGMVLGTIGRERLPKQARLNGKVISEDEITAENVRDVRYLRAGGPFSTRERVEGLAASYSYYFNHFTQSSWYIRFESGYGRGHKTHNKQFEHSINLSYQF